jgi:hypothetical protein
MSDDLNILSDSEMSNLFAGHVDICEQMVAARKGGGDIAPMLIVVLDKDDKGKRTHQIYLLKDFPETHAERCHMLHMIGESNGQAQNPVVLAMLVTMAWMVQRDKEMPVEEIMKVMPSEAPDRQEVMVCTAASYDRRSILWSRPTTRKGDLSKPIEFEDEPTEISTMDTEDGDVPIDLLDAYWQGYAHADTNDTETQQGRKL